MTGAQNKVRAVDIETTRAALAGAPERGQDAVSRREAVRRLIDDIRGAQKKGYRLDAIAAILSEHGIDVTPTLLKTYLSHAGSGRAKKKKKRSRAMAAAGAVTAGPPPGAVQTPPETVEEAPQHGIPRADPRTRGEAAEADPGAPSGERSSAPTEREGASKSTTERSTKSTMLESDSEASPSGPTDRASETSGMGGWTRNAPVAAPAGSIPGKHGATRPVTGPETSTQADRSSVAAKRGAAFVPRKDSDEI